MKKKLRKLLFWKFFSSQSKIFLAILLVGIITFLGCNFLFKDNLLNIAQAIKVEYIEDFSNNFYKNSTTNTIWDTV